MGLNVSRRGRAAALAVVTAVVAGVLPAAMSDPAGAGASTYNLSRQTFPDGQSVVARWNPCQKAITYRINTKYAAPSKAGRAKARKDVKGAVARLSAATGMSFRYTGSTSLIPKDTASSWSSRQRGAEIYIAWVKQSKSAGRTNLLGRAGSGWAAGSGGYAYKFWKVGNDPWRGAIGRGFVVLDSSQNKKFKGGFGSGTTRGDLLLHELGHVMGLNHAAAASQVMYPTIQKRDTSAYASGDLTGLAQLGRAQGCVAVPGWVWKNQS